MSHCMLLLLPLAPENYRDNTGIPVKRAWWGRAGTPCLGTGYHLWLASISWGSTSEDSTNLTLKIEKHCIRTERTEAAFLGTTMEPQTQHILGDT